MVVFDDGRPLAQSNAIILHLAEGSGLIPTDAFERAKMLKWMVWEQYSHEPYVAVARFQVAYLGKAVSDLKPKITERGKGALQRLEDGLAAGAPFLVSDRHQPGRWGAGRLHALGQRGRLHPRRLSRRRGVDRAGGKGVEDRILKIAG